MLDRHSIRLISCLMATACTFATAHAADYRGAAAGWPNYANGYYAANYPTNSSAGGAYYVARPVSAGYAAPTGGMMYVPVRAAYANPTYYAAYGRSPAMYQPVSAGYAPVAGGYYAPPATYAPVTANYAPANGYAVAPAGISGGSEAANYFGQPTAVNYVPPRVTYRPAYQSVPVYMYRPVTAYDPVYAQPTTCLQASTCNTCMPQPRRCGSGLSWLNPFTWFGHRGGGCGSSCGTSGCGTAPATSYCQTNYCGSACGQPYYPAQPAIPLVPAPAQGVVIPQNAIPAYPRGVVQQTIPPPPTLAPGARTIINPADTRPSLPQGFTPVPGPGFGTPVPSGGIPAQPFGTPVNPGTGGSFPTTPQPGSGFGGSSFPSGTNYAPAVDPYSSSALTPAERPATAGNTASGTTPGNKESAAGPNHSVFGSGYSSQTNDGVIRAPELGPALPPGVQTVPDPDAQESPRPMNGAPRLLDPRDKTASRDPRWAVVPAQWPTKAATGQLSDRPVAATKAYQPAAPLSASPYAQTQASGAQYDDAGWKTAAF